jgi:predicted ATPase
MIRSLKISGYKTFDRLELGKLGSLNLFVGKNNTGKTCLLEAVELYASGSPWDILRVASRRDAESSQYRRLERHDTFEIGSSAQTLLSLFNRAEGRISKTICLSAGHPEADLRLDCAPFLPDALESEAFNAESGKLDPPARRRQLRLLLEEGFILTRGNRKSRPLIFERYLRRLPSSREIIEEEGWLHSDIAPVAFLPARGFSKTESKRLWDKASLADKDDLLLDWLRFIEPEVRDLRYISDPESGGDVPYLKSNGDRGRTPLSSMGDGLTRLFHIGLAMATASGGVLLIDEFENGLHWEVQGQLWKALFEAASRFGVQVFATTHSSDCIRAFVEAQNARLISAESCVYRLDRKGDSVRAQELLPLGLEAAFRQGIEVR